MFKSQFWKLGILKRQGVRGKLTQLATPAFT